MEIIVGALAVNFILPLLGSLVLGLFAGIVVECYIPDLGSVGIGAIVAFATFGIQLFLRVNLDRLEKMIGIDLNRDGLVGGRRKMSPEELFLKMAKDGKNLSEKVLVPDVFSRKQRQRFVDKFLAENVIRWKSPKSHAQGLIYCGNGPEISYSENSIGGEPIELS